MWAAFHKHMYMLIYVNWLTFLWYVEFFSDKYIIYIPKEYYDIDVFPIPVCSYTIPNVLLEINASNIFF